MGYRNREIEKKFTAEIGYKDATKLLESIFDYDRKIVNASKDYYWHPGPGMQASFIRLRYMPDGTGQLTIKHADRDTNLNRIEIDVATKEPDQAKKFLQQLVGEPCGSIFKKYHVLFMGDEYTTVSIYQVRGDSRTFIEIEATSMAKLEALEKKVAADGKLVLTYEPRSLYEIFFKKG